MIYIISFFSQEKKPKCLSLNEQENVHYKTKNLPSTVFNLALFLRTGIHDL